MSPEDWHTLQSHLDVLLPLDASARQQRLDAIAAEAPQLATTLCELLATESRMPEAPDVRTVAMAFANVAAGEVLGPFVLDTLLGEGGSSVVYRAHRASDFSQTVAIKVLRSVSGRQFDARFRQERDILASLSHPNIARLFDGGATEDGRPYLVLEYVEGTDFVTWSREPGRSVASVIAAMIKVCDAVDYAHRRLLVHRDLKPANILIDADGEPKLLDFGVAKLLESGASSSVTQDALAPLTPAYAAPEQVSGTPVTTATDVYSLGVVLFEALCGDHPYRRGDDTAAQLLHKVSTVEPPCPSDFAASAPAGHGRVLMSQPGDLDHVVLHAMDKRPEARYASAGALADDLRAVLASQPVRARARTWRYLAARFAVRHRIGVALAGVAAMAVVAATSVALWQGYVASRERARAEKRFDEVRQLANRLLFRYADGIKSLAGSLPVQRQLVQDALGYLAGLRAEAGDDPALLVELGSAYARLGDMQGNFTEANAGDFAGAAQSYALARELLNAASERDRRPVVREALAELSLKEAHLAYQRIDHPLAERKYQESIAAWRDVVRSAPERADTRLALAAALDAFGDFLGRDGGVGKSDPAAALPLYAEARGLREKIAEVSPNLPGLQLAIYESELRDGESAWAQGRKADAVGLFERALTRIRRIAAAEPDNGYRQREVGLVLTRLVPAYEAVDRLDASISVAIEAAGITQRMLAADPGNEAMRAAVTSSAGWAARQLMRAGRFDEAAPFVATEMTVAKTRLAAAPDNIDVQATVALAHRRAGNLAYGRRDFDAAIAAHQQARAMQVKFRGSAPENDMAAALSLMHAGRAQLAAKRGADAYRTLQQAAAEMRALVSTHPTTRFKDELVGALNLLGDAALNTPKPATTASAAWREALALIDGEAARRALAASELQLREAIANKLARVQG
ncbi:MAG: serine/threonine protein kinase [Burkholderiales bacterium]|nr:serine/threonine protein kinase [Burkholderiales bacterium]